MIRSNNNRRPAYLNYSKMKQKGIEDLKQWSDEQQQVVGAEGTEDKEKAEKPSEPVEEKPEEGEIDLLGGFEAPAPAPVEKEEMTENQPDMVQTDDNGVIDLLGGPAPTPQAPVKQPENSKKVKNTDLFDLDLNL